MLDKQVEIVYPTPYHLPDILGGGEVTMHAFLKEFVKRRGWKATVFLLSRDGKNKEYEIDGVNVIERDPQVFEVTFKTYLAENQISVGFISSIDVNLSYFFYQCFKSNNVPIVTYEQFYRNIYSIFQDMLNIPIEPSRIPHNGHEIIRNANVVMVNSDYTGLVVKRYCGRDSTIVYPPMEIDKAIAKKHDREYVTLINPSQHKGRDTFLALAQDFPATKFLIVEMPKDKANDQFYLPNITVMPFQEDVSKIFEKTKVLLFPTLTDETFGRSMVEAMANGIPVLARNVGGIPYVLGEAGILVDRNDPHDTWFRELKKLLEDDKHYGMMSRRAFNRYKNFNYDTEIGKAISIVDGVIDKVPEVQSVDDDDDDDDLVTKTDKMDVHDDFINDDGTSVKTKTKSSLVGEKGEYDLIALSVNFPSVREILVNVVTEVGKFSKSAYVDFQVNNIHPQYLSSTANAIKKIEPKLLLLGAWIPHYYPIIENIKKTHPHIKIGLSWHSNFSQMELSPDREADKFLYICNILKTGKIDYLFMSDSGDADLLSHTIHENIFWLPDFLRFDDIQPTERFPVDPNEFNVSLFAFPTARKNVLAQVAATRAVRGSRLHINNFANRNPKQFNYLTFMKALDINHTHHGWLPKQTYINLISSMDIGLQVTFAETFSIVAAEHMALGVPCLVSGMVPVMKHSGLDDFLIIKDANSARDIAAKLAELRDNKPLLKELGQKSKEYIYTLNERHKVQAVNLILEIMKRSQQ